MTYFMYDSDIVQLSVGVRGQSSGKEQPVIWAVIQSGREMREEESVSSRILRGKPTRCRAAPDRPAPLGWRGGPRPTRTAPLGMTKTPTLRDSADLLDLNAAIPPGRSPPVGYGERGAIAP